VIQRVVENKRRQTGSWNPRKQKHGSFPKKIINILFLIIILIDAVPAVAVSIYYFSEFRPHLPVIEKMIAEAPAVYKAPPRELVRASKLVQGDARISYQATKHLVAQQLGCRMNIGKWHFSNLMWELLIHMHFDDNEIFTLWCYTLPYGKGRGVMGAAQELYQRDPDQLNTEELIAIVVNGKAPGRYKANPTEFQERVATYIQRYNELYGEGG
jgi:hypothetical protein